MPLPHALVRSVFWTAAPLRAKLAALLLPRCPCDDARPCPVLRAGRSTGRRASARRPGARTAAPSYTVDPARSWAQAVAVRAGRIVYVGTDVGREALHRPEDPRRQARRPHAPAGLPGRAHPPRQRRHRARASATSTTCPRRKRCWPRSRECAKTMAGKPWLLGGGWLLAGVPRRQPEEGSSRRDRPRQARHAERGRRPLRLGQLEGPGAGGDHEGHAGSQGRPHRTRSRDAARRPGRCARAPRDLVAKHAPEATAAERLDGLRRTLALLAKSGVTAVQEASAGAGAEGGGRERHDGSLRRGRRRGQLTVRVVAALGTDNARGPEQVDDLVKLRSRYTTARVKPIAAKIFADGVIEPRTAAMLSDYTDRPGWRGEPNLTEAALNALVLRLGGSRLQRPHPRHRRSCGADEPRCLRGRPVEGERAGPAPPDRAPRR